MPGGQGGATATHQRRTMRLRRSISVASIFPAARELLPAPARKLWSFGRAVADILVGNRLKVLSQSSPSVSDHLYFLSMLPMLRPPVFLVLGIFCGLCCGGGKFGGVPPVVAEEVAVARGEFVADDVVVVEADAPERVSTGGSAIPQEAAIAELIDAQETFKPLAVTPPTGGSASVRGSSGAGSSISCCGGADVIAHHADVLKLDSPFKEAWVQRTVARSHRHDDAGEAWPVQVVMNPHGYRFELFTAPFVRSSVPSSILHAFRFARFWLPV